jgi:hypothetical protein
MKAIHCPKCRTLIGHEIRQGNLVLVQIGGVVLREFHGFCAVCGQDLHHFVADRILRGMLRAAKKDGIVIITE